MIYLLVQPSQSSHSYGVATSYSLNYQPDAAD
jgi:hypothetical protein